jgi:hypothetical protein
VAELPVVFFAEGLAERLGPPPQPKSGRTRTPIAELYFIMCPLLPGSGVVVVSMCIL